MTLKIGKYQHFKGKFYEVIALARNSENLEEMVVYRALYDDEKYGKNPVWVRPLKMFLENVEKDGYVGPRFRYIGD